MAKRSIAAPKKDWRSPAKLQIIGQKIIDVIEVDDGAPAIVLGNGTLIILMQDHEGNGPGAGFVVPRDPNSPITHI
jgi:hypothetical protein